MTNKRLNLTSDPNDGRTKKKRGKKKFLGIRFECCSVYARIYLREDGTAYEGRCPRCLRPLRIRVGAHGKNARFFRAQ